MSLTEADTCRKFVVPRVSGGVARPSGAGRFADDGTRRSDRPRPTGLALAALVFACVASGDAQQTPPGYTEQVEVARVLVDTRVVDGVGNPVLGLGADDFRVKIDGKPARVESALWVGGTEPEVDWEPLAPSPVPGAAPPAPLGRLIVFLFQKDLGSEDSSRITGLMRMLAESARFLETLTPDDRVAILSFDYHLKIWIDFTNDRERLRHVLERGILMERPPAVPQEGASISLIERLDPEQGRRTYRIEEALRLIGEALEPLPGSKSVVLFGYGFGRLRFLSADVMMENGYSAARNALQSARASVFSVDVTNADYHSLEGGLQLVAQETGGFFVKTNLFPQQAIRRLAGALAGSYVLFVEKPPTRQGTHRIDVQLTRRKGRVLARSGYTE